MLQYLLTDPAGEAMPLCLRFANTLLWHASPRREETLHSYSGLVIWAQHWEVVTPHAAQELLHRADQQPATTLEVYVRAINLRETIYRIFSKVSHAQMPLAADLESLNHTLRRLSPGPRLVVTGEGFAWDWGVDESALDWLLWPLAHSAAELLVSDLRQRVGECADERGCGWLFLDTSKNHSRRWCDINDCGNRAKQRRHYARSRQ